jgi:hypothetical protein
MSFTWNELVGLGIIQFLQDPELVLYFLKILGPRRRDFLDDEYRSSYYKWALHGLPDHKISSLKTRRRITFFKEDSILIHPMVEWRKGEVSYEEASTYFLNGGTLLGCRSASLKEKIYSMKNLLTESLIQYWYLVRGPRARGRQTTLLMIEVWNEGMENDESPIPLEMVKLELRII